MKNKDTFRSKNLDSKELKPKPLKKLLKKALLKLILFFIQQKKTFVPVYVKYKRNLVVFAKSQSQGGFFVEANAHQNLIVIIYNFEANQ